MFVASYNDIEHLVKMTLEEVQRFAEDSKDAPIAFLDKFLQRFIEKMWLMDADNVGRIVVVLDYAKFDILSTVREMEKSSPGASSQPSKETPHRKTGGPTL
jgi:hypothetical protein